MRRERESETAPVNEDERLLHTHLRSSRCTKLFLLHSCVLHLT